MIDKNGNEYEECIVGNIVGDHVWGKEKIIRSGIKHFSERAKVYCIFMYGGMGHEQIRVMGKPRKSFRLIDVIISAKYIYNFRVQKVYTSRIIEFIKKYKGFANPEIVEHYKLKEKEFVEKAIDAKAKRAAFSDFLEHGEEWVKKNYPSQYDFVMANKHKPFVEVMDIITELLPSSRD